MATALTQKVTPRSEHGPRVTETVHHHPVRTALRGVGIFAGTAVRVVLLGQAEPDRR